MTPSPVQHRFFFCFFHFKINSGTGQKNIENSFDCLHSLLWKVSIRQCRWIKTQPNKIIYLDWQRSQSFFNFKSCPKSKKKFPHLCQPNCIRTNNTQNKNENQKHNHYRISVKQQVTYDFFGLSTRLLLLIFNMRV